MTFDTLCRDFNATPEERDALAWHLAMLRARQTYDCLRLALQSPPAKVDDMLPESTNLTP